jgi:hypothetical protein
MATAPLKPADKCRITKADPRQDISERPVRALKLQLDAARFGPALLVPVQLVRILGHLVCVSARDLHWGRGGPGAEAGRRASPYRRDREFTACR